MAARLAMKLIPLQICANMMRIRMGTELWRRMARQTEYVSTTTRTLFESLPMVSFEGDEAPPERIQLPESVIPWHDNRDLIRAAWEFFGCDEDESHPACARSFRRMKPRRY